MRILFILSLLITPLFSFGQGFGSVSGTVQNIEGLPVPFATIIIENTSLGATTDDLGRFLINKVPGGEHTLVFSMVAFKSFKINVAVQSNRTTKLEAVRLEENINELNTVEVHGESLNTEARKISEQAIVIDVFDLKNDKKKASSLTQLLNLSTGVKVRQAGGIGSETNINLNGMQGKSVRLFRDEIPLDYLGKAFDISLVPTSNLDRVEVYKGVLPAEIGSDALGGGINLVSKKQIENNLNFSYAFGSFNSHEFALSSYTLLPGKKLFVGTQSYYVTSDNNYKVDAKIIDDETKNYKNVRVRRFHDEVSSLYLSANVGLLQSNIFDKAIFEVGFLDYGSDLQHDMYMTRAYGEAEFKEQLFQANINLEKRVSKNFKANLFAAYSRIDDQFTDTTKNRYNWLGEVTTVSTNSGEVNNVATLQKISYDNVTSRLMLSVFEEKNHSLIFSHNYKMVSRVGSNPPGQKIMNTDIDPLTIRSNYSKNVIALGLKSKFLDQRITNVFSVKGYSIATSGVDIAYSYTTEAVKSTENIFGFSNSIKYSFSPNAFVRASYERSARIPDAEEYFGNGLTVVGNLDLKSERSNNLNVGYTGLISKKTNNKIDINFFLRDQENLVALIPWLPFGQYTNWAEVRGTGIEISNSGEILSKLSYVVNITYQDVRRTGIINESEKLLLDSRVPNTPFFFSNASLSYTDKLPGNHGKVNIYTSYGMTQHYYLFSMPKSLQSSNIFEKAKIDSDLIIPSQHVIDFGTTYTFQKLPIDINFEINNILDEKLYDRFRVQKPGRNFRIKISYRLNKK